MTDEQGGGWHYHGDPAALERTEGHWQVRVIQPYQARKRYRCPGCDHEVLPGTLHVVVWPADQPELRRHWHRACWERHGPPGAATR